MNKLTQALRSVVQLLQCVIATGEPSGVVIMSITSLGRFKSFSRTIIEKEEVPAETFPVLGLTAFVATIPVPASPSGGQRVIPAFRCPLGSSFRAPSSVSAPAFSPAFRTSGRIPRSFQGYPFGATKLSNAAIRFSSKSHVSGSMGIIPEASPTPRTFLPVRVQWM